MNRNVMNHFALAPQANISRSRFRRPFTHKTTFGAGKLIPIYNDEVLPGDTVKMDYSFVCRMSTPVYPVMDNCYLDVYFFFVPYRLVWEHWEEFNGYNVDPWVQTVEYEIPHFFLGGSSSSSGSDGVLLPYSLADYYGLPTYVNLGSHMGGISCLPFRSYVKIWNDWFRDENLQSSQNLFVGDQSVIIWGPLLDPSLNSALDFAFDLPSDNFVARQPAPVSKFADYFTTALPSPQKGDPVSLPLGQTAELIGGDMYDLANAPLKMTSSSITSVNSDTWRNLASRVSFTGSEPGSANGDVGVTFNEISGTVSGNVDRINLYANLANATAATINDLRMAFQLQKLYERDARGGTRYTEILKSHFGVTSPGATLQRAEYLGGKRFTINMQQVLQTSSTDETSPQGNTAAYSLTAGKESCFTKSFVEHGQLIGVCCVRTDNTYQQGMHRMWSRRRRFDFYWPVFANIGEQAVLNKEIYAQGTDVDDEVFGYQEAWAEYRYSPSRVSGAFRSNMKDHGGSLDAWHYAQYYESLPVLSDAWIREGSEGIQRTLAQGELNENEQFIADFYFDQIWTRPMPMYSVPGLIDHH